MPKPPKEQRVKDLWSGSISSFTAPSAGEVVGFRSWLPDGPPRKLIFIVHGLHEHCGRYGPVAELLAQSGCAVYAHDHIAHGLSEGAEMGFVEDYNKLIDTTVEFVQRTYAHSSSVPVHLLCHSMGVLIGALALAKLQVSAVLRHLI
jgi:alpha-beta hydrolase superfamily lysophospholipase